MKKTITILGTVLAVAFAGTTAQAQKSLRFGVKGGLNLSHAAMDFSGTNVINDGYTSFGPGFFVGGLAELSFPKGSKFKLQLEVLYNVNFHTFTSSNSLLNEVKINHQIVQIPLSVKYFVKPDFSLNAGLSANFNTALEDKATAPNLNTVTTINPMQLGAHLGATYYIKKGFFVDGRYNYTFGSSLDYNTPGDNLDYNYGTIQLGLGYKF